MSPPKAKVYSKEKLKVYNFLPHASHTPLRGGPFSMHAPLSEIGDTIHRFTHASAEACVKRMR